MINTNSIDSKNGAPDEGGIFDILATLVFHNEMSL